MADLDVTEKQASLGHCAIGLEPSSGSPVVPDVFVPLYSEDVAVNINVDDDNPIVGIREARYKVFRGQEDYQGTIRILAEPKTAPHLFNMLLLKGTSTGTPTTGFTHPFTLGKPDSYTLEINKGDIPFRFFGVEAKAITPAFEENKMVLEVSLSALGQFSVARITSAASTTIVLDDSERANPADGLVAGDTLRLYDVSAGTYEDVVLSDIASDGKTLTVASISGTYVEGDYLWLKPLSPSYSLDEPFNWGRTEFRFASGSAAALSATQVRVEKGSSWNLMHNLEDEAGAKRSGKYRPEALVRTTGDLEVNLKKFFKDGQEQGRFLHRLSRALVIRHFSPSDAGSDGTDSELRITVSEFYARENTVPLATGEIVYNNIVLAPVYNSSDSQMFKIEIVNSLAGANYE